jgi:hypothetical protein
VGQVREKEMVIDDIISVVRSGISYNLQQWLICVQGKGCLPDLMQPSQMFYQIFTKKRRSKSLLRKRRWMCKQNQKKYPCNSAIYQEFI